MKLRFWFGITWVYAILAGVFLYQAITYGAAALYVLAAVAFVASLFSHYMDRREREKADQ